MLILFILGFILVEFLFSFCLAMIFKHTNINFENTVNIKSVLILFMRAIFIMSYIVFFIKKFSIKNKYNSIDNKTRVKYFIYGTLLGLLSMSVVILIRYMLKYVDEFEFWKLSDNIFLIAGNILITFFTVIIEEYVFRRTIFIASRKWGNSFIKSSIITSLVFSLLHLGRNIGIMDLVVFFIFSIFLCF